GGCVWARRVWRCWVALATARGAVHTRGPCGRARAVRAGGHARSISTGPRPRWAPCSARSALVPPLRTGTRAACGPPRPPGALAAPAARASRLPGFLGLASASAGLGVPPTTGWCLLRRGRTGGFWWRGQDRRQHLADQVDEDGLGRGADRGLDLRRAQQLAHVLPLLRQHQGHHCPTGTGAGGTSRTVQVG